MFSSEPSGRRRPARSSSVRGSRPSRGSGGMRGAMAASCLPRAGLAADDQNGRVTDPVIEPTPAQRPATDFGAPGVVSHFRGPFADGPPAAALHVETPTLDKFGVAELKRMVVIYLTFSLCILKALVGKVTRQRKGS